VDVGADADADGERVVGHGAIMPDRPRPRG